MKISYRTVGAMLAMMALLSSTLVRAEESVQDGTYESTDTVTPKSVAASYAADQPVADPGLAAQVAASSPCNSCNQGNACGTCCPQTCCAPAPIPLYFGAGGGYTSGLGDGSRSPIQGNAFVPPGVASTGRMTEGYNIQNSIGVWVRPALRADLSYNYVNGTYAYAAENAFPIGGTTLYKAHNQSHVGMVNTYFHPNVWATGRRCMFDPYFGGGLGFAVNRLGVSHSNDVFQTAFVDGGNRTSFAARGAAGMLVQLTERVNLDLSYSVMTLGHYATGPNVAAPPLAPIPAPFGGFNFGQNVIGSLNVGVIISR
jgi:opacity protein-like surface antigen